MKPFFFRTAAACLIPLLLFGAFPASAAEIPTPAVSASSAALYEPSNNIFLCEKDANTRRPMASTTKIMTALLLCENADLDQTVTVPKEAVGTEGSSLYLKEGETVSFRDLLYGLLLRSANDAAVAVAILMDGSVDAFAERMNRKASDLCLADTHFTNPHGLDHPDHYTTAADLARLAAYAMDDPVFASVAACTAATLDGETPRRIANHNKLLRLYPGANGVKTGFTKKSGRCLVGSAERDGVRLICVTLNAPNDWDDHTRLFDLGFSLLERRTLSRVGDFFYRIPVLGGETSHVTVCAEKEICAVDLKSEKQPSVSVRLSAYATAPVRKGEILGKVLFEKDGRIIGEAPLVATDNVNASRKKHRLFGFK